MPIVIRRAAKAMALAALLTSSPARAELPVTLSQPSPEYGTAATQLVAELRAEGYVVQWLTYVAVSPCSDARPNSASGIWIELGPAAQQSDVTITICYRPVSRTADQTRVVAPLDPPRRLAIATVEALHGLRAGPRPGPTAMRQEIIEMTPSISPPEPLRAAFLLGLAFVTDPTGAGPVPGVELGLLSPLHRHFAVEVNAFIPAAAAKETGADRTLRLRTAWLRAGVRWTWALASIELFASVGAGAALVWAASEPTPPLLGTTRLAAAALVSAGVGLTYPHDSLFSVFVQAHGSRLFPKIDLRVDALSTRAFGNLLLDGAFGVAIGWR